MNRLQDKLSRKRVGFIWPLIVVCYALLMGRLVYLQTAAASSLQMRASQDRKQETVLAAARGRILDRNGKELAFNMDECTVILHPALIKDKVRAAGILARNVGISQAQVLKMLRSDRRYIKLDEPVSVESAAKLRQDILAAGPRAKINGVETHVSSRRVYPLGSVCSKLVGMVNSRGVGTAGVEQYANGILAGKPGALWGDFDRNGRPIPTRMRRTVPAEPGRDIVLTIDSRIQYAAQKALSAQVEKFKARSGTCVVLDPKTGEILALAEAPTFNPDKLKQGDVDKMTSPSMIHLFEPGSTMKLLTAAAALRNGLQNVTATCTGRIPAGSKVIACPCAVRRHGGGPVTIARMLQYSCNTESSTLARRLGATKLYDELKFFGIFDQMEVPGLGRTIGGMAPDPHKYDWPFLRLANVSFGQGVATTRMNLACAYGAIANGGTLLRPQLIRQVQSASGSTEKTFAVRPIRRIVTQAQSATLLHYLENTVEEGTGKNARIEGYLVGGKTGSAQIPKMGGGGFEPGAYCSSFIGIAPLDDPRLTILVSLEKPHGSTHGATVAAPVFHEVAAKALWYVGKVASPKTAGAAASGRVSSVKFGGSATRQG
ncbi:MAG: penicillin-binding protein 2 [Armatimonadetes bacterium]|nr:penicillin-binding protein 2 [Armatimonadota bacterium]